LFLNSALQDNLIQIKIAQLALQASSNPNVLQLAQLIVADRTSMAQQTANTPPASAAKKMKASLAKFQPLTGEAFDEAFLKQVIKDDKTSLNDYKIEVAKGADTLIASWADRGAFIMARHLKIAEQISQSGAPVVSTNTPARPAR
jgi:putative membrane protein